MQVEDVARIGFAARRAAQQQRHLAVGDGLLGEVVISDQRMHSVVTEILTHRAAGKRRKELHRCRVGRGGGDDDGVFERAALLQHLHELRDRRALLADGDVDAVKLLVLGAGLVDRLLVQDRIEDDGSLAGLAVADHQFALAATDRDQGVNGLQTGRHRLVHRLARNDARRLDVHAPTLGSLDRPLAVNRVAERVHDTAEQRRTDRHLDDGAGALYDVAFLDVAVVTEDDDADIVGLEVLRHTADAAGEFHHLAGLDIVETVDAGDTVTDRQHLADFGNFGLLAEILDLILENCGDFRGADVHQPTSFSASLSELSFVLSDVSIWREPIFTPMPPSSEGSTVTAIETFLPATLLSVAFSSFCWAAVSAWAAITCASASPRASAAIWRKAWIMPGTANRRRLAAATRRKLAARPLMPALLTIAEIALSCSSEEKTGLLMSRLRSGLESS